MPPPRCHRIFDAAAGYGPSGFPRQHSAFPRLFHHLQRVGAYAHVNGVERRTLVAVVILHSRADHTAGIGDEASRSPDEASA